MLRRVHTHINIYIHTYIHTYIQVMSSWTEDALRVHTHINNYIHTCIHTYIQVMSSWIEDGVMLWLSFHDILDLYVCIYVCMYTGNGVAFSTVGVMLWLSFHDILDLYACMYVWMYVCHSCMHHHRMSICMRVYTHVLWYITFQRLHLQYIHTIHTHILYT